MSRRPTTFRPRCEALEERIVLNLSDLVLNAAVTPNPGIVNQPFTVIFNITNQGPQSPLAGITLTANIFSGVTVLTLNTDQGTVFQSGGTITANLGNLIPGQAINVTMTALPQAAGTFNATASVALVSSADSDLNLVNNMVTISTPIVAGTVTPGSNARLDQCFVAQAYRDLLGREADAAGLASFTNQLVAGHISTLQVAQTIESSTEYQADTVVRLYTQLLHRPVDPTGLSSWVSFLTAGGTVQQVEGALVASDEYFSTRSGGTTNGFLQASYHDLLGRAPDPVGLQAWTQALAGGATRGLVAQLMANSLEANQLTTEGFYTRLLGRPADPGGLANFAAALQAGAAGGLSVDQLAASLVSSAEYLARVPCPPA